MRFTAQLKDMKHNKRIDKKSAKALGFDADKISFRLTELGKEPKYGRLEWKNEIGGDVLFKD